MSNPEETKAADGLTPAELSTNSPGLIARQRARADAASPYVPSGVSPLPWKVDLRSGCVAVYSESAEHNCLNIPAENFAHYAAGYRRDGRSEWQVSQHAQDHAAYIAHSASAYPEACRLLEALANHSDAMSESVGWKHHPGSIRARQFLAVARAFAEGEKA